MKELRAKIFDRFAENLRILYEDNDRRVVLHETEEAVNAAYDIDRYGFKLTEAEKISIWELISECTGEILVFISECATRLDDAYYASDALKVRTGLEFIMREFTGFLPEDSFPGGLTLREYLQGTEEEDEDEECVSWLSYFDKNLAMLKESLQDDDDEDEET